MRACMHVRMYVYICVYACNVRFLSLSLALSLSRARALSHIHTTHAQKTYGSMSLSKTYPIVPVGDKSLFNNSTSVQPLLAVPGVGRFTVWCENKGEKGKEVSTWVRAYAHVRERKRDGNIDRYYMCAWVFVGRVCLQMFMCVYVRVCVYVYVCTLKWSPLLYFHCALCACTGTCMMYMCVSLPLSVSVP